MRALSRTTTGQIAMLSLILTCALIFSLFLGAKSTRMAIIFLVVLSVYLAWSYVSLFHGDWGAAGNENRFNREYMFSFHVLVALAVVFGFVARVSDLQSRATPSATTRQRVARYLSFAALCTTLSLALAFGYPLSFERPIDLTLCDADGVRPDYCP